MSTKSALESIKDTLKTSDAASKMSTTTTSMLKDTAFSTSRSLPGPPSQNKTIKRYTYAVGRGNFPNHIIQNLNARGNWTKVDEDVAIDTANFLWQQLNLSFRGYDRLDERLDSNSSPFFFNHFEVTRGITTKTGLIRTLKTYYEENEQAKNAGYTVFDTTPTTFVISRCSDDHEMSALMHRYREISRGGSRHERVPLKHCEQNMWLVKPASLNQGRGIEIFRNMRDISDFIFQKN